LVCQDVFVLLKFEAQNRRAFINVDGWQVALGNFVGTVANDQGVFELGVKVNKKNVFQFCKHGEKN